jgi:hypothetical protein
VLRIVVGLLQKARLWQAEYQVGAETARAHRRRQRHRRARETKCG